MLALTVDAVSAPIATFTDSVDLVRRKADFPHKNRAYQPECPGRLFAPSIGGLVLVRRSPHLKFCVAHRPARLISLGAVCASGARRLRKRFRKDLRVEMRIDREF